jgi:hypothetical protein
VEPSQTLAWLCKAHAKQSRPWKTLWEQISSTKDEKEVALKNLGRKPRFDRLACLCGIAHRRAENAQDAQRCGLVKKSEPSKSSV